MMKDYIKIGGREYRCEVNWNALSAFLVSVGRDTLEGLSNISQMKPSDISSLMAAAINEGERLDGRECNFSALDIGAVVLPADVGTFMDIYIRQSRAQVEAEEDAKKKDSPVDQ